MDVPKDPELDLEVDLQGFFRGVLTEALVERGVEATPPTSHYLVALMADFARPDELSHEALERPLPFLLEEALAAAGHERFERLRTLGDSVLYTSGFFHDHLEQRGVQLGYVSGVGAHAYGSAASMLRRAGRVAGADAHRAPQLFEELAEKFARFADVLATISDAWFANSAQSSDSGMLRVYERWLKTGSTQLAASLATRGMMPTRGQGGLH